MKTIPIKGLKRIHKILSMGPHKFVDVIQAMHDFDKFVDKPDDSSRLLGCGWILWSPNNLAVAWPLLDNQAKFIAILLTLNAYYTRGRTD